MLLLVFLFFISTSTSIWAMKEKKEAYVKTYIPALNKPFKISRSKLSLFCECSRCFYLDCKRGVRRPACFPYTLNNAIDMLLKKEFDIYREKQEAHPLFAENNINAVPFKHHRLNTWRDAYKSTGIAYTVPNTNLIISGGIDDVWIDQETKELIIVDYKATSKNGIILKDTDLFPAYKEQIEIYQWLFRKNGFKVSNTAYFVYCNAKQDRDRFDKKLDFDITFVPYIGDDSWVEPAIMAAYWCLQYDKMPMPDKDCSYCAYRLAIKNLCDASVHSKNL